MTFPAREAALKFSDIEMRALHMAAEYHIEQEIFDSEGRPDLRAALARARDKIRVAADKVEEDRQSRDKK